MSSDDVRRPCRVFASRRLRVDGRRSFQSRFFDLAPRGTSPTARALSSPSWRVALLLVRAAGLRVRRARWRRRSRLPVRELPCSSMEPGFLAALAEAAQVRQAVASSRRTWSSSEPWPPAVPGDERMVFPIDEVDRVLHLPGFQVNRSRVAMISKAFLLSFSCHVIRRIEGRVVADDAAVHTVAVFVRDPSYQRFVEMMVAGLSGCGVDDVVHHAHREGRRELGAEVVEDEEVGVQDVVLRESSVLRRPKCLSRSPRGGCGRAVYDVEALPDGLVRDTSRWVCRGRCCRRG